jgi:hypothetical protein
MHIVGIAESPKEIAGLLDLRRRELGMTCGAVDDVAGLQERYSNKIFCGMKRLGDISTPALLGALGAKLVLCADNDWLPAVTLRHIGNVKNMTAWRNPPMLLPPPHAVFAAIPGQRLEELPAAAPVIALPYLPR